MAYLNFWAIIVAAFAAFIVGMLWYSPALFMAKWMKLTGLTKKKIEEQKKKGTVKFMVIGALAHLLMALGMAIFVQLLPRTIGGGLLTGLVVWAAFVATTSVNEVIWEGRPSALWLLNNGFYLLSLLVMGVIVAVWV